MTRVVVLDTETTGIGFDNGHRIIEVAAIVIDTDTRKAVAKFEERINPGRSIDPKAQLVHGIDSSMLVGKPDFKSIVRKLTSVITLSDLIIAHNLQFDAEFLLGEYGLASETFPDIPGFDTMKEFRWATPMGKLPNLKELCFACDVEYDITKAHAALYDCIVLGKCFMSAYRAKMFDIADFI